MQTKNTTRVTLIAAQARNRAIGYRNALPWRISADLQFFRNTTIGHPVVMGRKTWESLGSRPLPKRTNIVLSTTLFEAQGATILRRIQDLCLLSPPSTELFVIGGTQLYAAFLASQLVDRILLTEIDADYEGDAFFPRLDFTQWERTAHIPGEDAEFAHRFSFNTYERRY